MLSKLSLLGLTSLFLTACGVISAPPPQVVRLAPPTELVQECPIPPRPANPTNAELARWLNAYHQALEACNEDKRLLREHYAQ